MLIQSIQKIEKKSMEKGSHDAKVETAKKMLQKKYPVDEIAELTGLSVAEIKNLPTC